MDFLSTKQASEVAGIHPGHLRKLLAKGRVEGAQKIGRDWLIPREWAETFCRQRRKKD